jgi:hypothetical protein
MLARQSQRCSRDCSGVLAVTFLEGAQGLLSHVVCVYLGYITPGGAVVTLAGCYESTAQVLLYSYTLTQLCLPQRTGCMRCTNGYEAFENRHFALLAAASRMHAPPRWILTLLAPLLQASPLHRPLLFAALQSKHRRRMPLPGRAT